MESRVKGGKKTNNKQLDVRRISCVGQADSITMMNGISFFFFVVLSIDNVSTTNSRSSHAAVVV